MLEESGNKQVSKVDIIKPTSELPEWLRFGKRITTPVAVEKFEPSQTLIDMDDDDFYMLSFRNVPTSITFKAEKELTYEQLKYILTRLVKRDTVISMGYYISGYNHTITVDCPVYGGYELLSTACTNYELGLELSDFRINFDRNKSIAALINNDSNLVCRCHVYTNYSYILFEEKIRPLLARFALTKDSIGRFSTVDILEDNKFTDYINLNTILCVLRKKTVSLNLAYTPDVDFNKSKTLEHEFKDKPVYAIEYKKMQDSFMSRVKYNNIIPDVKYTMTGNFTEFIDFITIDGCIPRVEIFHA